jgi:hypothetical protein
VTPRSLIQLKVRMRSCNKVTYMTSIGDEKPQWLLKYEPTFLLMMNWIVIIYTIRDTCLQFPDLESKVLGTDFVDICSQMGISDWKQWIGNRRNVVAHGKRSWIEVSGDFCLTYLPEEKEPKVRMCPEM